MANEENLIPFDKRTENEQIEIARKGGIASGESRRAYKSLKQAAKAFFWTIVKKVDREIKKSLQIEQETEDY